MTVHKPDDVSPPTGNQCRVDGWKTDLHVDAGGNLQL